MVNSFQSFTIKILQLPFLDKISNVRRSHWRQKKMSNYEKKQISCVWCPEKQYFGICKLLTACFHEIPITKFHNFLTSLISLLVLWSKQSDWSKNYWKFGILFSWKHVMTSALLRMYHLEKLWKFVELKKGIVFF